MSFKNKFFFLFMNCRNVKMEKYRFTKNDIPRMVAN